MNAKHTPGPWDIGYGGKPEDGYATITSKHRNVPVADLVARHSMAGAELSILDDECAANARLIAAAPELLEACYAAKMAIDRMALGETPSADLYRSICAACAKAEGTT